MFLYDTKQRDNERLRNRDRRREIGSNGEGRRKGRMGRVRGMAGEGKGRRKGCEGREMGT